MVFLTLKVQGRPKSAMEMWKYGIGGVKRGKSYTLIFKPLYDCEGSGIVDILHDQPVDCLFIISIDSGSFDKLCFESNNGVRLVVGINLKVVSDAWLSTSCACGNEAQLTVD